jgi:hypothetical protein
VPEQAASIISGCEPEEAGAAAVIQARVKWSTISKLAAVNEGATLKGTEALLDPDATVIVGVTSAVDAFTCIWNVAELDPCRTVRAAGTVMIGDELETDNGVSAKAGAYN